MSNFWDARGFQISLMRLTGAEPVPSPPSPPSPLLLPTNGIAVASGDERKAAFTFIMIRSVLRDQTTRRLQGNRHDADVRDDPSKISCRGFRSKTASSQLTGNLYKCNRLTLICD
ncbi:hypothetical protein F2P81_001616 [Scophthalmus maximus]|uniref:Uncharacterized protein n=1 Tax=Scophthalmus maximus TaxID=52904 RepID=A0A6A4TEQ0_SCOMX|nr:hypothetical protein F2P81_001616 [Scophthalmus maximus]